MWDDESNSGGFIPADSIEESGSVYSVEGELNTMSTLTNICLNSIIENIDRFNSAYHETEDEKMKKYFLFLRRFYSNTIIKMLMDQRNDVYLDKKYFDFLINEHLNKLDWFLFKGQDLNIILEMLPKIGHTFENVSFDFNASAQIEYGVTGEGSHLERVVKKALRLLPNVKVIRMTRASKCNDFTLKVMYTLCKEVKELYIEDCPITSTGLKILCPENKSDNIDLQSLTLSVTSNCDDGVAHLLKNMPSLEYLVYENVPKVLHKLHKNDLHNNSLANVEKYKLTSLDIDIKYIPGGMESLQETLLIATELCPRITNLTVREITEEKQLQTLYKFSHLRDITIRGAFMKLDVSGFLKHSGKSMKHLDIQGFRISLSTLVENCPILESVYLGGNDFYGFEKENVNVLNGIKKIILDGIDKIEGSAEIAFKRFLDSCSNLEELHLCSCSCDEQTCSIIQRYCGKTERLEKLSFTSCSVEEAFLQQIILICTPLKRLTVDMCRNIGSYEIENLRDTVKASKSNIVVVKHSSKSDFFDDFGDDDIYGMDLDYSDTEEVDDISDDSWGDVDDEYDALDEFYN